MPEQCERLQRALWEAKAEGLARTSEGRVLTVSYADLLAAPGRETGRIVDFLGLRVRPDQHQRAMELVRRPPALAPSLDPSGNNWQEPLSSPFMARMPRPDSSSGPPNVMTIDDLASYLQVSKSSLYKLAQDGKVPGQKVGRYWRFHKAAIDAWLMDNKSRPSAMHHTD